MRELVPFGHFCSRQIFGGPLNSWTCRMAGSRHRSAHKLNLFSSWMPDHGRSCPTWTCPPEQFCPNRYTVQMLCALKCLDMRWDDVRDPDSAGGSAEANEMWLDASRTCQKLFCHKLLWDLEESYQSTWFGSLPDSGGLWLGKWCIPFGFSFQVWHIFVYLPCQGQHYVATMFDHSHSWHDHDYHDIRNDFLPLLNPWPILENCELGFEPEKGEKGHCCICFPKLLPRSVSSAKTAGCNIRCVKHVQHLCHRDAWRKPFQGVDVVLPFVLGVWASGCHRFCCSGCCVNFSGHSVTEGLETEGEDRDQGPGSDGNSMKQLLFVASLWPHRVQTPTLSAKVRGSCCTSILL